MADSIKIEAITDLAEVTALTDEDLVSVLTNSDKKLKKLTFSNFISFLKSRLGINDQKILWTGLNAMAADQTITLSEAVSEQTNGIVVVFSAQADGTAQNYEFSSHFIPKSWVNRHSGNRHIFLMASQTLGYMGVKCLYIRDSSITGVSSNVTDATTTNSGVKTTNSRYVLRYVIGV